MKVYDRDKNIVLETDKTVDYDGTIKIDGVPYSIFIEYRNGDIMVEPFAFLKEVNDLLISRRANCPFCGAVHGNIRKGKGIYKCDVCSSDFEYEEVVTVEYHTKPIKKNDRVVELC